MKAIKTFLTQKLIRKKDDLLSLITHSVKHDIVSPIEAQLIINSLSARNMPLNQAMLDKTQTAVIPENSTLEEVLAIYHTHKHSRYPVISESGDIVGVILMKDFIDFMHKQSDFQSIKNIMRPAHFSPDSQPVLSLLQEMQQTHQHMSIVLDEYGQFQGIVTIEDLLEQIVGQIEDEYDTHHPEYIKKVTDTVFQVSGLTPIDQFNQSFNVQLDINEFDTIAGILSKSFGHIPRKGETITLAGLNFHIDHASNTVIKRVTVSHDNSPIEDTEMDQSQ
ncbi:MAG: transporter associated domain-containing protein [Pseudomonadota bacterium]|nr:transporter associated domain-containing protein [Pseudomonadota bacterium]